MRVEWMGRYRELVAVLVQHSNITARAAAQPQELEEGVRMNSVTWQVLEYLIEHENDDACMIHISDTLGIPQSSFSRIARQLTELGLVARYRTTVNRKNVILKPSEKALQVYASVSPILFERDFREFFESLDSLDDEAIAAFTSALRGLNARLTRLHVPQEPVKLVKQD